MKDDEIILKTARRASELFMQITRPGETWVVPANVCPAVPLALDLFGVNLKFVDINLATLCLDVDLAAKYKDVDGIVYVRTYGCGQSSVNDIERLRTNLPPDTIIVDDACLGVPDLEPPATINGGADVALYSTGYGKVLDLGGGAYGFFTRKLANRLDGWVIDPTIFAAILGELSRVPRTRIHDAHPMDYEILHKYHKKNISCYLSPSSVPDWPRYKADISASLPDILAHKAKLNAIYKHGLHRFATLPDGCDDWRYQIIVANAKETVAALFKAGLFASRHYVPANRLWAAPNSANKDCQQASYLGEHIINLFNDQHFSAIKAYKVVELINRVAKENKFSGSL